MSRERGHAVQPMGPGEDCSRYRQQFSAYLDGALDGKAMVKLAGHLQSCATCESEFKSWREIQETLGTLRSTPIPKSLSSQLRDALAGERERQTHLSPWQQIARLWHVTLVPLGLRMGAGLVAALVMAIGLASVLGSALPVQANDDRLAHLNPPRFLYAQVPPEAITTSRRFVAVLVDAKVDARGHVYDYNLIEGPDDEQTRVRIESNLLTSVFRPATLFGVPVPGHVMMTYTVMSVRG